MMKAGRTSLIAAIFLLLAACAKAPLATVPLAERQQIEARLMDDIATLASDEFGGRQPGTAGETLTVEYIIDQMSSAGLTSGTNDPGSAWKAPVDLVSSTPSQSKISIRFEDRTVELMRKDAAAFTTARQLVVDSTSMIFVGFEADSVDAEQIAGKVVVMLGEPGISPRRRTTLFAADPAAIITVVDDASALGAVEQAYQRERVFLATEDQKRLTAFVTQSAMADALGVELWESLVDLAKDSQAFSPGPLGASATIEAASQRREFVSSNVIGMLPGEVPGSGAVLLLGHWDHLGTCAPADSADPICNGAVDNASGIAVLLELARRLGASGPFDRDIYFLATTAEESGLFGARAFADAPPMPLQSIVAAFNFDTTAVAPAGSPVGFVGEGRTPIDPVILRVLAEAERDLGDKAFAEQFVRRQDGWALLDEGVPAVFLSSAFASEIILGPYLSTHYHGPGDEIAEIELGGAIDDLLLHEELIRLFASVESYSPAQ